MPQGVKRPRDDTVITPQEAFQLYLFGITGGREEELRNLLQNVMFNSQPGSYALSAPISVVSAVFSMIGSVLGEKFGYCDFNSSPPQGKSVLCVMVNRKLSSTEMETFRSVSPKVLFVVADPSFVSGHVVQLNETSLIDDWVTYEPQVRDLFMEWLDQ